MKIAIYGKLRSGKTEVAKYISERLDCDVFDFADSLKECLALAYPESVYQPKNRDLLIKFGQHLRALDVDIWVNTVRFKIRNSNKEHIIVTGTRQQNEYEMLKEQGFTFIKVVADENIRVERCLAEGDKFTTSNLNNTTEIDLDNYEYDYLITNERGIDELHAAIREILVDILEGEEYATN